jgi:MoaA/NifB/PqqE/SkfB family radical SAM enzyme
VKEIINMIENDFIFAQIEITTFCNGGCTYCDHSSYSSEQCLDMELDTLRCILKKLKGRTSLLHLQGIGEPFLHTKITDVLGLCRDMGFSISTTTNLSVLDLEHIRQLDYLYISLDSISSHSYSKRKGIKQEVVLENLRYIITKPSNTRLYLTSVASPDTIPGLVEVLDFYQEHRNSFESMLISPILSFKSSDCMLNDNDRRTLRSILADYPDLNLSADFLYTEPDFRCSWLKRFLYIDVSGKLRICCVRTSSDNPSMNFIRYDLNSREFTRALIRMNPSRTDPYCMKCIKNGTNLLWRVK